MILDAKLPYDPACPSVGRWVLVGSEPSNYLTLITLHKTVEVYLLQTGEYLVLTLLTAGKIRGIPFWQKHDS